MTGRRWPTSFRTVKRLPLVTVPLLLWQPFHSLWKPLVLFEHKLTDSHCLSRSTKIHYFGFQCFVFPSHLCCTLLVCFYKKKTLHGFISHWREKKEETSRYIFISCIWHSRCQGCPSSMVTAEMRGSLPVKAHSLSSSRTALCYFQYRHWFVWSEIAVTYKWLRTETDTKNTHLPSKCIRVLIAIKKTTPEFRHHQLFPLLSCISKTLPSLPPPQWTRTRNP